MQVCSRTTGYVLWFIGNVCVGIIGGLLVRWRNSANESNQKRKSEGSLQASASMEAAVLQAATAEISAKQQVDAAVRQAQIQFQAATTVQLKEKEIEAAKLQLEIEKTKLEIKKMELQQKMKQVH